jgi:two-component system sensor histidine kinase RcsD
LFLLVTMGVMVQSGINAWLKVKSYQIADITQALHKRVDTYRYATWQIYDNIAATASPGMGASSDLQETRLRQDVYYLEKPRRKTEALIFGSHDSATLEMTQRISSYLDTLWGAENIPWSLYYLNGQDNSTILVSTLPLKDLSAGFKESSVANIVDARRAEMLQQANALDERESFSPLRRLSWQNGYYFTLRTTFNQPGHLATVVAFDMPINDLVPHDMALESFRLQSEDMPQSATGADGTPQERVHVFFNGTRIEIRAPVGSTPLQLVWQVPFGAMTADTLQNILLPLLLNIGLLALALFGYSTFRHAGAPRAAEPNPASKELQKLRALNEEIVSLLPLGLLVHDPSSQRTLISNPIADHLLPHLNLQNIASMAEQHQGVIQATVDNEVYEIRQFSSQILPRAQIFVIRDQDREILVNKKLRQAQKLYEKNQQGRAAFMQHIGAALKEPVQRLVERISIHSDDTHHALINEAQNIVRLVEEIQLLNALESDTWKSHSERFALQSLIDDVATDVLPVTRRKGLQLLINNGLAPDDERYGDREALYRIVLMIIQYSVISTQIGKITLDISAEEGAADRLLLRVIDTGNGISSSEIDNVHFPFLNATSQDDSGRANGLTFWLCDRLARRMGGHLNIKSHQELGTRYSLHIRMPVAQDTHIEEPDSHERLLEDVVAMVDITSSEVRQIVTRQLENWGASCITPDERAMSQAFDLFLTDNPSNLTASGLLLSDDEQGVRKLGPGQYRVNFNISYAMQEAVLQLIEEQLAQETVAEAPPANGESVQLHASGYYALFVDTVPVDVEKLYTESATNDFASLAQTAHRLKGVFAMLNLIPGKQLCETLEHHIREKDASFVEKYISRIDDYVQKLL